MNAFISSVVNQYHRKQSGVSLVELMISITLGLFIMAGVLQLFATSSQSARTAEGSSRIQENARYVLKRLADDIARAGSFGCVGHSSANITNALPDIVSLLDDAGSWNDFSGAYVSGVDEDNTDAAVLDGSDTLVLKYADASAAEPVVVMINNNIIQVEEGSGATFSDNQVVMVGDCARTYIAIADVTDDQVELTGLGTAQLTPRKSMAFAYSGETGSHRYYIGTSAGAGGETCAALGDDRQYCALFRQSNGGDAEELVQGVHSMEISYGQDSVVGFNSDPSGMYNSIDRIQVAFEFNFPEPGGGLILRNITRVFAVRNQR